jgi:ATP-binding cassette subfamily C (CFTR/MRP) protein 1
VDNQEEEAWKGYLYATVLLFASVFNTMIFSHYVFTLVEVAIQIRSSLIAAIFRKSLRLSNASRQKFTTGEITNYVSVDTQRLLDSISYLGILWGSPYQVILSMAFLYQELGLAALAGCLGLALLMPQNIIGGKIVEKLQEKQLTAKDSRIKVTQL